MKKNYPLSAKQLQIHPISCQVKTFANTATIPPLMRKQRRHCHSERSRVESKNLKWLSQRKANIERPYVVSTLGHDMGAALAAGSCSYGL